MSDEKDKSEEHNLEDEVKMEDGLSAGENGTEPENENTEKPKQDDSEDKQHVKEHHKKKHEHENEKFRKMDKEDLIKEIDKLLNEREKLEKTAIEKEKESTEYLDRYRRALADMENVRKRTVLEKQDSLKYANFNIVSDLLTILDDFQRAIDSAKSGSIDFDNYKVGIEMIEKQFLDLLFKKYGVVKYGEKDEEFDPNIHSAALMEEGEFDKEVILDVFRNGYSLHDRVIRPAQVKIGKPKS